MKNICVILVTLLNLTSILKAQTLTNEFNNISTYSRANGTNEGYPTKAVNRGLTKQIRPITLE
jgi:hypothetical protein